MAVSFLLVFATAVQLALAQTGRNPACAGEADVIFLIDASSSTTASDFALSISYLRSDNGFLRLMELSSTEYFHSQVGVVTNKDNGKLEIPLGNITDFDQLSSVLLQLGQTGYVSRVGNLTAAMKLAADEFSSYRARPQIPHVLFLIVSDVLIARSPSDELARMANIMFGQGITIMAAVYGNSQDPGIVNSIVSAFVSYPPDDYKYYFLDAGMSSSADGSDQRNKSMTQLCIEIPVCASFADIAIMLDTSGNVWPDDWTSMIAFVVKVVQHLYVSQYGARIALAKFHLDQELIFGLNQYSSRYEILRAIESVVFVQKSKIDIASAITFVSNQIFSDAGGYRLTATHILILITTGFSNVNGELTASAAQQLQDRGVYIFGIGVGPDDPKLTAELKSIASKPTQDFFFSVTSFDNLQLINTALVERACRPKPAQCNSTIDLVFLIDTSGSIPDPDFQREKGFMTEVIARLQVDDGLARVGVVTFADNPYPQIFLGNYTSAAALETAVRSIPYSGGKTNTSGAIQYVREVVFKGYNGARPGALPIMILMTDGQADDYNAATYQAKLARDAGTGLIAIGIGDQVNAAELNTMATYPSDRNTYLVPSYDILSTIIDSLIKIMCSDTANCASNPCQNGGICEERLNSFYCRCVGNFTGRFCDQTCNHYYADIIFVLDSSGSITADQYGKAQKFIRDVIQGVNVDAGSRVGLVLIGDNPQIQFQLKDYNTTEQTLNAINFRYLDQTTDTAGALRVACQNMFTPENGDRPNAMNILVLMTDGNSNNQDSTLRTAMECQKLGIQITAIGIGVSVDRNELSNIVTPPSEKNFIPVPDYNALTTFLTQLLNSLCNTFDDCMSNPCANGSTCVDGINRYTCICATGSIGVNCNITCLSPADVTFMVDYAASVRWEVKPNITNFIKNSVTEISVNNDVLRVALMYYTDQPHILVNLSASNKLNDLLYAAYTGTAPINGKSNLTAALISLERDIYNLQGGDRKNATNIAVIVIDAVPTVDFERAISEVINAHTQGIYTILVTVGQGMNSGRQFIQLQTFASDPVEANFFNVWNFTTLPSIAAQVASKMCNERNECLSNPCQNGGSCIDGINQYSCSCDSTHSGVNCQRACTVQLDVVFIVDVSGSLELGGYDIHVDFMNQIVDGLNFQYDRLRLAFVTFSEKALVQFYLNKYFGVNARQDIKNALKITNVEEGTDISEGLRITHDSVLTQANGKRPGVPAVCILLSDGKATLNTGNIVPAAQTLQTICTIYAVSVQPDPQQDVMDQIATSPPEFYTFQIPYRSNVTEAANDVLDKLCGM